MWIQYYFFYNILFNLKNYICSDFSKCAYSIIISLNINIQDKFMMIKKITLLILIAFAFSSCVSRKSYVYVNNISEGISSQTASYEPVIKPDDLLVITVSSPIPEAALRFNLLSSQASQSTNVTTPQQLQDEVFYTYLVDFEGNVTFPVLGVLKIGGLKKSEAIQKINTALKSYITEPITTIRIMNYKISVLGEVAAPGEKKLTTERVTLPEAISLAGDMTTFGRRDNVLVIREVDGKKTFTYVDMTKADLLNSPVYYLAQNDLVIVEPNKPKINGSAIGPNLSIIITSASLVLAVVALIIR